MKTASARRNFLATNYSARPDATINEVMTTDVVYATVDEDQEQVARTLAYYDFIALPVVDATQKLVGIITYDDAMDIAEAESTEIF